MKFYLLPVYLLIVSLFSCSYQKLEFEKQSGKTNQLKTGEKFCISLPEDHTTKYLWSVKHDYDKNVLSYMQSVFHGKSVEFNFETVKPGKTEVTLYLSSYKDTTEVRNFMIEVK